MTEHIPAQNVGRLSRSMPSVPTRARKAERIAIARAASGKYPNLEKPTTKNGVLTIVPLSLKKELSATGAIQTGRLSFCDPTRKTETRHLFGSASITRPIRRSGKSVRPHQRLGSLSKTDTVPAKQMFPTRDTAPKPFLRNITGCALTAAIQRRRSITLSRFSVEVLTRLKI